jgi:hypothetical protein
VARHLKTTGNLSDNKPSLLDGIYGCRCCLWPESLRHFRRADAFLCKIRELLAAL